MRLVLSILGASVFAASCGSTTITEYREGATSPCQLGLLEYCPQNTLANPELADVERRYYAAAREYDEANARYQDAGRDISLQRARIACLLEARQRRAVGEACQQYLDSPRIAQAIRRDALADEIRVQRNQLSQLFPTEAARRTQRLEALNRYGEALGNFVQLLEAQGRTAELQTILQQNYANQESIEFVIPPLGTQDADVGWDSQLLPGR